MKKKRVLIMGALLTSILASAQDPGTTVTSTTITTTTTSEDVLRNKKGHEILPKGGDIALGFNTIPVLDLLLGTLNRATPFAGSANVVQYTNSSNNLIMY